MADKAGYHSRWDERHGSLMSFIIPAATTYFMVAGRSVTGTFSHRDAELSSIIRERLLKIQGNAKDCSKYKAMNSQKVTTALKARNYLTKWVN